MLHFWYPFEPDQSVDSHGRGKSRDAHSTAVLEHCAPADGAAAAHRRLGVGLG